MTVFIVLLTVLFLLCNALVGAGVLAWLDADTRLRKQLYYRYCSVDRVFGPIVGTLIQICMLQFWFIVAAIVFYDMAKNPKDPPVKPSSGG